MYTRYKDSVYSGKNNIFTKRKKNFRENTQFLPKGS